LIEECRKRHSGGDTAKGVLLAMKGDLTESVQHLFQRTAAGIRPGLDVMEPLLERLGNPHREFGVVHVAGTNGKGSVCAFLERLLSVHGVRTGLYTSPHLVRFNERFRVNGEEVDDDDLAALITHVEQVADQLSEDTGLRPATFFEISTAIAFEHFRRSNVQVAVIETGMGGRWDATNVVVSLLAVLTPISVDHTQYLGHDLAGIAAEKCGIIKSGRPVVTAEQRPVVQSLIEEQARQQEAPLVWANLAISAHVSKKKNGEATAIFESEQGWSVRAALALPGRHQVENAALALCAFSTLWQVLESDPDPDRMQEALQTTRWPGRGQVISEEPFVMLDGAHNSAGARSLRELIRSWRGNRPVGLVMAFMQDKEVSEFVQIMAPEAVRCWTAAVADQPRSLSAEEAAQAAAGSLAAEPCADSLDALTRAVTWARSENGRVVVCGSLFLVGEVLEKLYGGELIVCFGKD
jgi:dihydrofolate synthase/folylpolyglutamate synthase